MSGFTLFGVNLSGAEYDPGGTLALITSILLTRKLTITLRKG
jgi:hypothetical protein